MFRRCLVRCATVPATNSVASLWGDSVKSVAKQVYGRYRRVQLNIASSKELKESKESIDATLLDQAEGELRVQYWGEWGDEGALGADLSSLSTPEVARRFAHLLVFCVVQDPTLRKNVATSDLSPYARHKSAVCQSMYLSTVQQAQVLLPQHLLDFATIELLTKAETGGCSPPAILPSDKEAIQEIFQYWSDAANKAAGVEPEA